MKIVAIKKMAAGNESVGEMWEETKIFDASTPVIEIVKWAGLKKNITITLPENEHDEYHKKSMPF